MKTCTCCKEEKLNTPEFFYLKNKKLTSQCKKCIIEKQKKYSDKDGYRYFNYIKRKYGITKKEYDSFYTAQKGLCKICGEGLQGGRKMAVDHDHSTGKVRGFLCFHCNTGLGHFKDNPDLLLLACDYLLDHVEFAVSLSGDY